MKKYLLSFMFILLGFFNSQATNNEWELSENFENENFGEIATLEALVERNTYTLADINAAHPELLQNINLNDESAVETAKDMPILGAFWWGCCLGVVGVLLVYIITDNDKGQMKSALIGCVIVSLLVGVGGLLDPFGWF